MKNITTNTFGPAFKKLREKRGYSISEACRNGNIMTPAALRKFENTSSSTSIENFNRLLIAIGATWDDFWDVYEGDTVEKHLRKDWGEIVANIQVRDYYNIERIARQNTQEFPDNPFLNNLPALLMEIMVSKRFDSPKSINEQDERFDKIKEHLERVLEWGSAENFIYSLTQEIYDVHINEEYTFNCLKQLKQHPIDYIRGDRTPLYTLFLSAAYFSKRGKFKIADQLIAELESLLQTTPYIDFLHEKISIKMIKGHNLLRQNNPKGLELAKEVVAIERLFQDYFYTPQYFISVNTYIDHVHSLNKTGIPFDPY